MPTPAACGEPARILKARAKVNLTLHVTGRRADGLHLLDGLVVFPETADLLDIREADEDRLSVRGPMAGSLDMGDNLVSRALLAGRRAAAGHGLDLPPCHIRLDKRLPVAAGLGGGSADAAAVLRWIGLRHPVLAPALLADARALGADVPMCLEGRPARVRGIGEIVLPLPAMPALAMVLVNPGTALATPAVFARRRAGFSEAPETPAEGFETFDALLDHLRRGRNDLEPPALELAPEIGEVKAALEGTSARLVRMSGSGASVFALYDDRQEAQVQAARIASAHPRWWVQATHCIATQDQTGATP